MVEDSCRIIEQALRQSEIRYERTSEDTYRVLFQGDTVKDIIVCIRVAQQWIQVLCLFGRRMRESDHALLAWMLQQNHIMASVKFSLNTTGDILIQSELPVESLDLRTLQTQLQAVVNAVDTLYEQYLTASR